MDLREDIALVLAANVVRGPVCKSLQRMLNNTLTAANRAQSDMMRKTKYKLRRGPREKRLEVIKTQLKFLQSDNPIRPRRVSGRRRRRRNMDSPDQVMCKLVKRLRNEELRWVPRLVCPVCRSVPSLPVTGDCGHTWCAECARECRRCPCGAPAPSEHGPVNVLVRRLIDAVFPRQRDAAEEHRRAELLLSFDDPDSAMKTCKDAIKIDPRNVQLRLIRAKIHWRANQYIHAKKQVETLMKVDPRLYEAHYIMAHIYNDQSQPENALKSFIISWLLGKPMSAVHDHMYELVSRLTRSEQNTSRLVNKICRNVKAVMKKCNGTVEEALVLPNQVDPSELECIVCSLSYLRPVTTPCGHTFCRLCIERCLDHNLGCPLCNGSIERLRRSEVQDSAFVKAIASCLPTELQSRAPETTDMLPLMVCTAGFPSVSCPLLIKEGRYRLMVRRCLESGVRRFGMVSCRPTPRGPDQPLRYSEYGTILQIKDCVTRDDGCLILSTVGLNRFRVVSCEEIDGYDMARVETVCDKVGTGGGEELVRLHSTVRHKAQLWLRRMIPDARDEIEHSFGPMPPDDIELEDDGPAWVWWLLAALPLTVPLKMMLLGTTELVLRLRAIDKTLELRKWSLREQLRHELEMQEMELEYLEYETPISPNVEEWLVSAGSLDGETDFAM